MFDFVGGLADLQAGIVRFVGDAAIRIREDYLRILRLFRFQAWYGAGDLDPLAFEAAKGAVDGIRTLSGERIAKEMLKLLAAANPGPVVRQMQAGGILTEILPGAPNIERLARLCAIDARHGFTPDAVLRLAALGADPTVLAARWHVSKATALRLALAGACADLSAGMSHKAARARIYRLGEQTFRDQVFLGWAAEVAEVKGTHDSSWFALLEQGELFEAPVFPLSGRDGLSLGLGEGVALGAALGAVRAWWIERDFLPTRGELLERLKAVVQSPGK